MSEMQYCSVCLEQVRRLGTKPFFEAVTGEGILELAATLHRYGHGRSSRIIDEALIRRFGETREGIQGDRVPSSSDIWALCRCDPSEFETTERSAPKEASLDCPLCFGCGWIVVVRGGYEGADRCKCGSPPSFEATREARRSPRMTSVEIEALRRDNEEFAAQLTRDLCEKRAPRKATVAPTQAEIDAIKSEQDRKRLEK